MQVSLGLRRTLADDGGHGNGASIALAPFLPSWFGHFSIARTYLPLDHVRRLALAPCREAIEVRLSLSIGMKANRRRTVRAHAG